MVRLGEVAEVELAAEDLRNVARSDGKPSLSLGIVPQSTANVLEVAEGVKAEMALVKDTLPADITHGHQHRRHGVRQRLDQRSDPRAGRSRCCWC